MIHPFFHILLGQKKRQKTNWYLFEAKGRLPCRMRASIIWSVYNPDTINIILPTTLLDVLNYESFSDDGAELNEIRYHPDLTSNNRESRFPQKHVWT